MTKRRTDGREQVVSVDRIVESVRSPEKSRTEGAANNVHRMNSNVAFLYVHKMYSNILIFGILTMKKLSEEIHFVFIATKKSMWSNLP